MIDSNRRYMIVHSDTGTRHPFTILQTPKVRKEAQNMLNFFSKEMPAMKESYPGKEDGDILLNEALANLWEAHRMGRKAARHMRKRFELVQAAAAVIVGGLIHGDFSVRGDSAAELPDEFKSGLDLPSLSVRLGHKGQRLN